MSDDSNNISYCTFNIIVEKQLYDGEDFINIYPNPIDNNLTIISIIDLNKVSIEIFDINGRLVKSINFSDFGFERSISVEELSTGIYFFSIITNKETLTKRILKN